MTKYVALLRGINVGKAKRISMADLRALLLGLGYTNVTTLLNSGNAVFSSTKGAPDQLAREIAKAISTQFRIEVPVIVKSTKELAAIVAENQLTENAQDHSHLLVAFVQEIRELSELKVIETLVLPPEQFLLGRHAVYLHCPIGILESKAGAALLGKVGKRVTTRNWATLLKLQALADGSNT